MISDMLALEPRSLAAMGVSERVRLAHWDMTRFASERDAPVDLAGSVSSLHHLLTRLELDACLGQMGLLGERYVCGSDGAGNDSLAAW